MSMPTLLGTIEHICSAIQIRYSLLKKVILPQSMSNLKVSFHIY